MMQGQPCSDCRSRHDLSIEVYAARGRCWVEACSCWVAVEALKFNYYNEEALVFTYL